jgi:hypothetical protein
MAHQSNRTDIPYDKDNLPHFGQSPFTWNLWPCYLCQNDPKTFKEAIRLIDAYDDACGYEPMEFICEL